MKTNLVVTQQGGARDVLVVTSLLSTLAVLAGLLLGGW